MEFQSFDLTDGWNGKGVGIPVWDLGVVQGDGVEEVPDQGWKVARLRCNWRPNCSLPLRRNGTTLLKQCGLPGVFWST